MAFGHLDGHFYDVTISLNFSHESIDITSIGLDKANTKAPFCIVMDTDGVRSLQPLSALIRT